MSYVLPPEERDAVPRCPQVRLYAFLFALRAGDRRDTERRLLILTYWLTMRYGWSRGGAS